MAGPNVIVNIDKIEANARSITSMCGDYGIEVTGVTKVTCGMPSVARALLRGGVKGIGESRLENVHRLRANGIVDEMMLLRIPPLSETDEIVRSVDISLNSELSVIRSLSRAAEEHGLVHNVILMIDLGDLREGLWPEDVLPAARETLELPNLKLKGVGTNLTCYGGVIPTEKNMLQLVDWAHRIEDTFGVKLETISGGNSSSLPLLKKGNMPQGVNHLRIGEALMLGRETVHRSAWPGTSQDAFLLEAELIELKKKPSVPIGETGEDAFGKTPTFEDKGKILRGILNIGREDVDVEGLQPVAPQQRILGASSDHLLVDLSPDYEKGEQEQSDLEQAGPQRLELGDKVAFRMNYSALLAAMTSAYVSKREIGAEPEGGQRTVLRFFGGNLSRDPDSAFHRTLRSIGYRVVSSSDSIKPGRELQTAIAGCVQNNCMPVLCGQEQLSPDGFTACTRSIENAGLLWLSPGAGIIGDKKSSPAGSLGQLLQGENEHYLSPAADNIVLVGLREVGEREAGIIRRLGITVYTMEDIDSLGISAVLRKALQRAVIGTRGVYVYFDERLADGGQEGLTNRETHLAMEMIARSGFMRVLDVSGAHTGGRSGSKLKKFVASALGKRILGP
ncbi:MAG: alanine racemase [Spirochaetaceae bacterium]|nr:alanine racemase [Spirochaetaceae bacterium]MCF7947207.1 alanine racemase [Spirochaetia bacterium]MCF7950246.1 alanine racemase [Spirochaetaceae bacterium]